MLGRKMHRWFYVLLTVLFSVTFVAGEKPQIEDKPWEEACGGSNIRVTKVEGKITLIEAEVEHFSEARQWVCLYQDGNIISAVYKHFLVKREAGSKEGEFTTKLVDDQVLVFHFPNHQLEGMDAALLKDLKEVIGIASKNDLNSK